MCGSFLIVMNILMKIDLMQRLFQILLLHKGDTTSK